MKNLILKFTAIIFFLLAGSINFMFLSIPSSAVLAAPIVRSSGDLSVSGDFPLLSDADGVWYPGRTLVKTYLITNNGNNSETLALSGGNLSDPSGLCSNAYFAVYDANKTYIGNLNSDGEATNKETLSAFMDNSQNIFGNIDSKKADTIYFAITLNPQYSANQKLTCTFDLSILLSDTQGGLLPGVLGATSTVYLQKSAVLGAEVTPSVTTSVFPSPTTSPALTNAKVSSSVPTVSAPNTLISSTKCTNATTWIFVLIALLIIYLLSFYLLRKRNRTAAILIQIVAGIICSILLLGLSCSIVTLIYVLIITIVTSGLLANK